MSDDHAEWASGLDLPDGVAKRFTTLSDELSFSAADLIATMVTRIVETDDEMRRSGLPGLAWWGNREERVDTVFQESIAALPTNIRPTGFMWPAQKPFPWTAAECKAAVVGYAVKWPGDLNDFNNHLRGRWEMSDGYAFLWQS